MVGFLFEDNPLSTPTIKNMKAIYISRNSSSSKKIWLLALILVVGFMLLCMRVMAPYAIESWINKRGPDNQGFAVRINNIDFKIIKGEMLLEDVEIFDTLTRTDFAEISQVKIDFDFFGHLKGEDMMEVTADHVNLILTNDILQQLKALSAKSKGNYTAHIKELVVNQMFDDKTQRIFTLNHSVADVKNNKFSFHSKIADGGMVEMKGEKNQIEGKLTGISPVIVSRLSEEKLPVEIKEEKMNASFSASSTSEGVEGTLKPETNNFKLVHEKKPAPTPWWIKKKELDPLVIEIPFTLKDNVSLDFTTTVEELRKRNL